MYTPKYELIEGDAEIAKGVRLFETPGHTAGHYSLMVELAGRRPMLFTADAIYAAKSLELRAIASFHVDPSPRMNRWSGWSGWPRSTTPSSSSRTIRNLRRLPEGARALRLDHGPINDAVIT